MKDNLEIPIEVIKEICKQSEIWEINNPRVIAMFNNIFKCLKEDENLDVESKETLIYIVFSNLIIYSRYKIT
tara:strand:+ start:774 stop:989 length:216 start_codon:yes stop_codon:yes gene_type:complete